MAAPVYKDLSLKLEKYIIDNNINGKLPGTRQLSREFGVNHITLLKALHLLEEKGVIFIEPARGIFTSLSRKRPRHNVLALISANLDQPGNREIQSKLEQYLKNHGYNLIGISFDSALFKDNKQLLLNFPVDGFLFRLSSLRNDQAELLLREKIPFVSCARRKDLPQTDQTDCDHMFGYNLLLDKLLSMGHRRIAFCEFGRIPEYRPYLEDIYSLFAQKMGDSFDESCFYTRETGLEMWEKFGEKYWDIYPRRAVEHFLNLANPPTAIIAPFHLLNRIHKILCQKGVRVPQDISLASMNYASEKSVSADFTRIVYDEEKMLFWGIDRLLAKLVDNPPAEPAYYFQKPEFIPGKTTAVLSKI